MKLNKGFLIVKRPETKNDKSFLVVNEQSSFLEVVDGEGYKPGTLILVRDIYHQYEDSGEYLVVKSDDVIGSKNV